MAPPTKVAVLNAMRRLYSEYLRTARRKNHFWGLTVEEFHRLTSSLCTYCRKPPAQKRRSYLYNGIDRLNNKQGYTPDNCVPACYECNFIKGNRLNFEEMKAVGKALSAHRQRKKKR